MSGLDSKVFDIWRKGYGPIVHREETVERVQALVSSGRIDPQPLYRVLAAADRLASAAEILSATEQDTLDRRGDAAGLAAFTF